jgi:hypothetical protein
MELLNLKGGPSGPPFVFGEGIFGDPYGDGLVHIVPENLRMNRPPPMCRPFGPRFHLSYLTTRLELKAADRFQTSLSGRSFCWNSLIPVGYNPIRVSADLFKEG